jgi:hydrogenase large subunit
MTLAKLGLPVRGLFSTLGRTAARTLETKIVADAMQGWYDDLVANIKSGDTRTFNETLWDPPPGPGRPRAPASWRPRGGRSVTGS